MTLFNGNSSFKVDLGFIYLGLCLVSKKLAILTVVPLALAT
jgi:hypothetical protein